MGKKMRGVQFLVLFALLACAAEDAPRAASASPERQEWQTAAGKPVSEHEFAAVLAACEDKTTSADKAESSDKTESIADCFENYGLRRVQ